MEIKLPTLNVEEGNLVNIPIQVLTNGQSLGAVQLSMKYDSDLLEFKGVASKGATSNWLSFINANNNEVEWGGVDMSEQNKVIDGQEVAVLQFIAKKPKMDWTGSPLYVTRKFVGNAIAKDLRIKPTDGRVEVLKTALASQRLKDVDILIYPNPTTGIVAVQFNVPDNNYTSVYFVDLNGNKVANIVNDKMPKGEYRYTANLSLLPANAYLAVMECDGKIIASKKVLSNISL